jgi:hypothetical protein
MQRPTHSRLHVRDARDAHTVFEAGVLRVMLFIRLSLIPPMTVRQGFLRPVTRRLNEAERTACIQSGSVFVWEECNDEMGLKRWTGEHHHVLAQSITNVFLDGRIWGQSRMREVSPKTTQASVYSHFLAVPFL